MAKHHHPMIRSVELRHGVNHSHHDLTSYFMTLVKPATHLEILYADHSQFDHQRKSDTPGNIFCQSRRCGSFENSCDKISQPDGLALLAIRSNGHTWRRPIAAIGV